MLSTSLKGLRVVDMSQIGAGPMCGMLLGDLGAEVVKIEPPTGDLGRKLGLPWIHDESPVHIAFNRNKRSLAVDLKADDGREILKRLLANADVLIESFRPGVMARFGLDFDSVNRLNPGLIYCSVSAFGQTGPGADKPGVDGIVQGESGFMSLIGFPNQEPCKVQAPVVDVTTGIVATVGVLAALNARPSRCEGGTHLDISLFASAITLQQSALTEYLGSGILPLKAGSAAPYAAPNEAFEAADGWLMVAAYNAGRWERLCDLLGLAGHPALETLQGISERVRQRAAMRSLLGPLFAQRNVDEWLALLSEADILCGRVADYHHLQANPQIAHLKLLETLSTSAGHAFRVPAFPINSASRTTVTRPPPDYGEHTREVLLEAGFELKEIERLLHASVIFEGGLRHA